MQRDSDTPTIQLTEKSCSCYEKESDRKLDKTRGQIIFFVQVQMFDNACDNEATTVSCDISGTKMKIILTAKDKRRNLRCPKLTRHEKILFQLNAILLFLGSPNFFICIRFSRVKNF